MIHIYVYTYAYLHVHISTCIWYIYIYIQAWIQKLWIQRRQFIYIKSLLAMTTLSISNVSKKTLPTVFIRKIHLFNCSFLLITNMISVEYHLTIFVTIFILFKIVILGGILMMIIAFITFKSSLVPLFEGLWSSNSWEFELPGFRRNRTDDLGIDSPSLWLTEPRLHVNLLWFQDPKK